MQITGEINVDNARKVSRAESTESPGFEPDQRRKKLSVARSFAGIWKQLVEKEKARDAEKTDSVEVKSKAQTKGDRPQKRSRSHGPKNRNALTRLPDDDNLMTHKLRPARSLTKSQTIMGVNFIRRDPQPLQRDPYNQENRRASRSTRHLEKYESNKETEDDKYEDVSDSDTEEDKECEGAESGDKKETRGEEQQGAEGETKEEGEEEEDYVFPDFEDKEEEDAVEPLNWQHHRYRRRRSKSNIDVSCHGKLFDSPTKSKANKRLSLKQELKKMPPMDTSPLSEEPPKLAPRNKALKTQQSTVWSSPPRFQGLWCEQKHVVDSEQWRDMGEDERKLQEVLFEVIATEENYMRSLDILFSYFKLSLENAGDKGAFGSGHSGPSSNLEVSVDRETAILQKYESEILFFNVGTIRNFSEKFLTLFELNQGNKILVHNYLESFTEYVDSVLRRAIIKYCSNMSHQREILKTLMNKNKEFTQQINELEADSRLNDRTFKSFLMVPMTRICQLPLLIERIVKVSGKMNDEFSVSVHSAAQKAYAAVQDVASQCNQETRKLEEFAEKQITLLNIERTLIVPLDIKFSLISSSRSLLCECNATLVLPSKTIFKNNVEIKLHFKLFHDILLVCKPVQDKFAVLDIADVRCGSVYLSDLSQDYETQNLERCKFLSQGQKQKQPISMVCFRTKVGENLDPSNTLISRVSDGPIDPQNMGPVCFQDYEQVYIIQPAETRELFIKHMRSCIANRRNSACIVRSESVNRSSKSSIGRKLSSIDDESVFASQHEIDGASLEEPTFVNIAKNSAFLPLSPGETRKFKYSK